MSMALIWAAMMLFAIVFGALSGNADAVGNAAMEGANAAVTLCISIAGPVCLWSGVMEVMSESALSDKLSALLQPVLRRLFPKASRDRETLAMLSGNLSANLLGLGNAATPLGIEAARGMSLNCFGTASDELCRLVVLNTASLQLLPTTVASVRAAAGSSSAFDILPAVWLSSALSLCAGLLSAKFFERFSK